MHGYRNSEAIKVAETEFYRERWQRIVENGTGREAYRFAKSVPGADIEALQQVIVDRGADWDAYEFARDVKGVNFPMLQQVVVDRGSGWCAFLFARDVENSNLQMLQQVVLHRGTCWDAFWFAVQVSGANIAELYKVAKTKKFIDMDANYQKRFEYLYEHHGSFCAFDDFELT